MQAAILDSVLAEEAAKVLILMDYWRAGTSSAGVLRRQLGWFNSHIARGIYVQVAAMSPANFKEVRRYTEPLRASQYLDGPNDSDWVFRNPIESAREELLYVDYVRDDEGPRWISPSESHPSEWPAKMVAELIRAMNNLGLLTEAGMRATHRIWKGAVMNDAVTWRDHAHRVLKLLQQLYTDQAFLAAATDQDTQVVLDRWTFPLTSLDLKKREVSDEQIQQERDRIEDRFYRDNY